jgi:hypothetical protein
MTRRSTLLSRATSTEFTSALLSGRARTYRVRRAWRRRDRRRARVRAVLWAMPGTVDATRVTILCRVKPGAGQVRINNAPISDPRRTCRRWRLHVSKSPVAGIAPEPAWPAHCVGYRQSVDVAGSTPSAVGRATRRWHHGPDYRRSATARTPGSRGVCGSCVYRACRTATEKQALRWLRSQKTRLDAGMRCDISPAPRPGRILRRR